MRLRFRSSGALPDRCVYHGPSSADPHGGGRGWLEQRSRAREIEMQLSFTYEANPGRTIFAPGSLTSHGDELTRLGFKRALIICTPHQRDLAVRKNAMLGDRSTGIFVGALMHVPSVHCVHVRDVA